MNLYLIDITLSLQHPEETLKVRQLVRGESQYQAVRRIKERLHLHLDASKCEFCRQGFPTRVYAFSATDYILIEENFHSYTGEIE